MEDFYGFKMIKEEIDGREAVVVCPKDGTANGHWALKTEYFGAFPETEIELVRRGYHLAHIKNITRWHKAEDTQARVRLAQYMRAKYGVREKCVIVGMSCGGMQGIYFAAMHPEYVSCMYLDAPVVNLLSCPAGLGDGHSEMMAEFIANKGMGLKELISFRGHPLDYIPELVKYDIPVILVCGDSDKTVPYDENGALLEKAYLDSGSTIKTILKKGCDHHPHGLDDNSEIVEFIEKYDI